MVLSDDNFATIVAVRYAPLIFFHWFFHFYHLSAMYYSLIRLLPKEGQFTTTRSSSSDT